MSTGGAIKFNENVNGQPLLNSGIRGTISIDELSVSGLFYSAKGTYSVILKAPDGKLLPASGRFYGC